MTKALQSPHGKLAVIDGSMIHRGILASRRSARRRIIIPLHRGAEETCQRMLNFIQPGSYIRPHRHWTPPKSESVVVLRGALVYVTFLDDGTVDRSLRLAADSDRIGIDARPGIFHTFLATRPDTVVFEAKTGPYDAADDKDFATWAPEEGDPAARDYQSLLLDEVGRAEDGGSPPP